MSEEIQNWFKTHQAILIFIVVQTIGLVIWGARIDGRVDVIEQRGSPQIDAVSHRLTVVETLLGQNSQALARIENDVKSHILKNGKVSPY